MEDELEVTSGTSSRPPASGEGDTGDPAAPAPATKTTVPVAATVFVPFSRTFVVDQDKQYPYCTYKEQ